MKKALAMAVAASFALSATAADDNDKETYVLDGVEYTGKLARFLRETEPKVPKLHCGNRNALESVEKTIREMHQFGDDRKLKLEGVRTTAKDESIDSHTCAASLVFEPTTGDMAYRVGVVDIIKRGGMDSETNEIRVPFVFQVQPFATDPDKNIVTVHRMWQLEPDMSEY
ncbi:MAG: hypothetical protein OXQ90_00195 [Gammaproteobacteria bacterium]|nr:hypothetical protein [Gammaproteobacteria bacterium]